MLQEGWDWTESHNRGEAAIGARGEASRMKREMRL